MSDIRNFGDLGAAMIPALADVAVSAAAFASGASLSCSQAAGLALASLAGALQVGGRHEGRPRLLVLLLVAVPSIFVLRSGAVELATGSWGWSPFVAFPLLALATSLLVRLGGGGGGDRWHQVVGAVTVYAVLLRLLYAARIELLPEETYYWNYSRHLDIGYLDHPPMVAWLIRLGTALFGSSQFGVRIGAIGCGWVAAFFIYRLARDAFGTRPALLALALSQVLPYFFVSGMLMTPDAPLTASWAASLYFLERALVAGHARAWWWAGLTVGVGLLSKYTIVLLVAAAFVFMVLDPTARRWLRRFEPYAALLLAVAVFAPVIVWNAEHDWASFAFQTARRLAEAPRFSTHRLIGAALVLLTPVGLVAIVAALATRTPAELTPAELTGADAAASVRSIRLLRIAVLVPVTVFFVFSFRHEVKLDWTGAPWIAGLPLLALGWWAAARSGERRYGLPLAWGVILAVMPLVYGAWFYHLSVGLPGVGYSSHMELQPVEWRDFGHQVGAIAAEVHRRDGAAPLIVGMDRYAIASELAFYSEDQGASVAATTSWHLFGDMGLMYARWFPVERLAGRTLLLVAFNPAAIASAPLEHYVDSLGPVGEGELIKGGLPVRRYFYRVAYGYRPNAAP